MLYRMVQSTAEKLTARFKGYSKVMRELGSSEANSIPDNVEHARHFRRSLVDLAGEEAVAKLDSQLGATKLVEALKIKSDH